LGPGDLDKALCGIEFPTDENLIVGLEHADDAGVYRINDELAMIQTVDFFTPIVDDPYWFGQIAAANALSDIYAMGGVPKTAMNLVGFPIKDMDIEILRQILLGGIEKLNEAEVVLVGGHSVEDKELKYGLSVTGFVHPDRVLVKGNLQPGDRFLLTKPLGTGIINTAIKRGAASPEIIETVTRQMAELNRAAAEVMRDFTVHACTDITGFWLLGHMAEMVQDSGQGVRLESSNVPILPEVVQYAAKGFIPGGANRNREFFQPHISFDPSVKPVLQDVFYDPQTSGGLLISVGEGEADDLLEALRENGCPETTQIGQVASGLEGRIIVN